MSTFVTVGKGSCGIAAGAGKIEEILREQLTDTGIPVASVGCIGMCWLEPIVTYYEDGFESTYVHVDEKLAAEIVTALKENRRLPERSLISAGDRAILESQRRIVLADCGDIDPENLAEYLETEGYQAAKKALGMTPQQVIDEVKTAGLRGRGGAGFPTWFKWQAVRDNAGDVKYAICNADEGDPGAFMDRAILEGNPHRLIEGMLIAAYAMGATQGIVYVRAEYPLAIKRLAKAIDDATAAGCLGENLFGRDVSFTMSIKQGAGAFVCGEETALIASLEGERGMPRLKPPFPAQKGLWGKPSNINNVETYANIPWILLHGGEAFAQVGTEDSKGTKVFALTGKINKGGLVEIPMGSTIRHVIYDLGGGIRDGRDFKAVQMGGPSGGCIPLELIDTPIDYKTLAATGAIMGSGGMVVMDDSTCMVDMARFFLDFTCKESCGKCTHCRLGTKRMLEILTRITEGNGRDGDIALLEDLAQQISAGSLCGLGQTAPNPVLTTLRYFRQEYEDHIYHKKCTAKQCQALIRYQIDPDRCTGCTLCAIKCPVQCIDGKRKAPHSIRQQDCTKCGSCYAACKFGAISKESEESACK